MPPNEAAAHHAREQNGEKIASEVCSAAILFEITKQAVPRHIHVTPVFDTSQILKMNFECGGVF